MQAFSSQRYALVTGAGSGLGRAFCLQLASAGYFVGVTDIDLSAASETLTQLQENGGQGLAEQLDVTDVEAWQNLRKGCCRDWPQLHLLINNAGICVTGEIGEVALSDFQKAMSVNFSGVLNGCHTMVPWLKECSSGGNIINVASIFGLVPPPVLGAYGVSKAAVVALSEALYAELRPLGIGVTVAAPGFFASQLVDRGTFANDSQRELAERFVKNAQLTSIEVAEETLQAANRQQLYVVLGRKPRWMWRLKRLFPSFFAKFVARRHRNLLRKRSTDD